MAASIGWTVIAKPYARWLGHSSAGLLLIAAGTPAICLRSDALRSDPYRDLPSPIRARVKQRVCRPPRRSYADAFAVARGYFFAAPRSAAAPNDWAVLCVRGDAAE